MNSKVNLRSPEQYLKSRMKTVVVVGAGASGIAAAGVLNKQGAPTITSLYSLLVVFAISVTSQLTYHLIYLGYKVIVLEGRDRVGGRVCEAKLMKNLHAADASIRHHRHNDAVS